MICKMNTSINRLSDAWTTWSYNGLGAHPENKANRAPNDKGRARLDLAEQVNGLGMPTELRCDREELFGHLSVAVFEPLRRCHEGLDERISGDACGIRRLAARAGW